MPPIADRWLGWTGMDIAGRLQQVTDLTARRHRGLAVRAAGRAHLVLALLRGFFMFLMRQTIIVVSRLIEYDLKNTVYATTSSWTGPSPAQQHRRPAEPDRRMWASAHVPGAGGDVNPSTSWCCSCSVSASC